MTTTLSGIGLHSGAPCSVLFARSEGPVTLEAEGRAVPANEARVVRTDRGVTVALGSDDDAPRIELVEHLFAAFGGLGVFEGVRATVDGCEIPLLGGGAAELARAISELDPPTRGASLAIVRQATLEVGASRYELEPADDARLDVRVTFDGVGSETASWDASPRSFRSDIAPARTFGFRSEAEQLRASGRAAHVDPTAVMVLDEDGGVMPPGVPRRPGELARHKLLDLIGDCYPFGGVPRGHLAAHRPGHTATREALIRALSEGIVERFASGVRPG